MAAGTRWRCAHAHIEACEARRHAQRAVQQVAEHLGMTENAVYVAKNRVMGRIRELRPQMEALW